MPTSGGTNEAALQAIMWVGVLITVVLVLGIVVVLVRKRLFSDEEREADGAGLVTSLRAARNRGEISQEEYEHTLRRIRGQLTGEGLTPPTRRPRAAGQGPQERRAPPGVDLAGDPLPPSQD